MKNVSFNSWTYFTLFSYNTVKKLVFFDLQFLGIHMCISIFLANICTNTLLPDHFENKTKNLHRYYMELILT